METVFEAREVKLVDEDGDTLVEFITKVGCLNYVRN